MVGVGVWCGCCQRKVKPWSVSRKRFDVEDREDPASGKGLACGKRGASESSKQYLSPTCLLFASSQ